MNISKKYKTQLCNKVDYDYQFLQGDQNIWFLTWILKQCGCDVYLNKIILTKPFTTKRIYGKTGKFLVRIISFKNDLKHGYEVRLNEYGRVHWTLTWKNGLMHGQTISYFPNAIIKHITQWKNGLQNGIEARWFDSGLLKWIKSWQNGLQNDVSTGFDEDGNVIWKADWNNGVQVKIAWT